MRRRPIRPTIAVRGGLALTGKAPAKPATALAIPTPIKSRSTSGPSGANRERTRAVAAVCTITTSAMMTASGAIVAKIRRRSRSAAQSVSAPPEMSPSGATPLASSPSARRSRGRAGDGDQGARNARADRFAGRDERDDRRG